MERRVGDLVIRIDGTLCVGFGECVGLAPEAFALNAEGVAVFVAPETVDRERLLAACRACPVDALIVTDIEGAPLVP